MTEAEIESKLIEMCKHTKNAQEIRQELAEHDVKWEFSTGGVVWWKEMFINNK